MAGLSAATALAAVTLGAWWLGRVVPALTSAWTPRLPALLTLGAVAVASGPEAVALVGRAVGIRKSVAPAVSFAAGLETAGGALVLTLPLALHCAPPPRRHGRVGGLPVRLLAAGS